MARISELGFIGQAGMGMKPQMGRGGMNVYERNLRGLGAQRDDATEGRTGPSRNSGSSGAGERGTSSGQQTSAGAGSSSTDLTERRMRATKEAAAGAQRAAASAARNAKTSRINQLNAEIERARAECQSGDRRACVRLKNFENELRDLVGVTPPAGGAPAPRPPAAPPVREASGGERGSSSGERAPPAGDRGGDPAPTRHSPPAESAPPADGPLPTPAREDSTRAPNGSTVMAETEATPPQPEPQVVTPQGNPPPSNTNFQYDSPPADPTSFGPPSDFKTPGDGTLPLPETQLDTNKKEKQSGKSAGAKTSTGTSKVLYVFGALGLVGAGYAAFKKFKK